MATTKKKVEPKYKVTLYNLGRNYTSSGKTLEDAINSLDLRNCRGKAVLTVERGENKKERVIMPNILNRVLINAGLSRDIAMKQLVMLFEGI